MITDLDLDLWQMLADRASKGPWLTERSLAYTLNDHGTNEAMLRGDGSNSENNILFAATLFEAVPALIAEVRRLQGIIRSNALDGIADIDTDLIYDKPEVT